MSVFSGPPAATYGQISAALGDVIASTLWVAYRGRYAKGRGDAKRWLPGI